jgi:hypothetical protein
MDVFSFPARDLCQPLLSACVADTLFDNAQVTLPGEEEADLDKRIYNEDNGAIFHYTFHRVMMRVPPNAVTNSFSSRFIMFS